MSAKDDHPFGTLNRYDQWVAMTDEIDSLTAAVERLENDIDGHRCVAERQEP